MNRAYNQKTLAPWNIVIIFVVLVFWVCISIWPIDFLMAFLSDDAFYYLEIGRFIAEGKGSTFDGLAETNGYHPLWMLVVVVTHLLTPDGVVIAAAVVLACSILFCGLTIFLALRIVANHVAPPYPYVAATVLFSPLALSAMTNGMETSLAMASVLGLVMFCYGSKALSPNAGVKESVFLGVILAFVFLSRLDLVFVSVAAGIMILASSFNAKLPIILIIRRTLFILLPFLVITAPYLCWNYLHFNSISPISGTVKSSFPALRDSFHLEGDSGMGLLMLALLVMITAFGIWRKQSLSWSHILVSPLVLLTFASVLHFLYIYFFMDWGVYWWHFSLSAVSLSIAIPYALVSFGFRKSVLIAAGLFLLLALSSQISIIKDRYDRHMAWLSAAQWANKNTDKDAVFAIKDAGLFSYFSGRAVVNLDGKANGIEYWQSVLDGRTDEYLKKVGVQFFGEINPYCTDGSCIALILIPNSEDLIIELPDSELAYVGEPYPTRVSLFPGLNNNFTIWRYQNSRHYHFKTQ